MSFLDGFEKAAYSYKKEIAELEEHYKRKAALPKADYGTHMGVGGGVGVVAGTGVGAAIGKSLGSAGLGALVGGGVGVLLGASSAAGQNLSRAEGKRIMELPPHKRKDHLEYLAHQREMEELKTILRPDQGYYYDSHAFNRGFAKAAAVSSVFKGTAKMLANEGEKALSHSNALGKTTKAVEERVIDYSKFNPKRLYGYKPTPASR